MNAVVKETDTPSAEVPASSTTPPAGTRDPGNVDVATQSAVEQQMNTLVSEFEGGLDDNEPAGDAAIPPPAVGDGEVQPGDATPPDDAEAEEQKLAAPPEGTTPAPAEGKETPVTLPQPEAATPPAAAAETPPDPSTQQAGRDEVREALKQERTKWRDQAINDLAEKHYALSDEEVANYVEDPAKFLPRIMAKVHMDVVETTMAAFANMFPLMMDSVTNVRSQDEAALNSFYGAWPELKGKVDVDEIKLQATTYRQLRPGASLEDTIKHVGAQLHVMHRIPVPGMTVEAPAAPQMLPPHKPASDGGGAPARGGKMGQIESFAEELLSED